MQLILSLIFIETSLTITCNYIPSFTQEAHVFIAFLLVECPACIYTLNNLHRRYYFLRNCLRKGVSLKQLNLTLMWHAIWEQLS